MGLCVYFRFHQKHQRKGTEGNRFKSPLLRDAEEEAAAAPDAEWQKREEYVIELILGGETTRLRPHTWNDHKLQPHWERRGQGEAQVGKSHDSEARAGVGGVFKSSSFIYIYLQ